LFIFQKKYQSSKINTVGWKTLILQINTRFFSRKNSIKYSVWDQFNQKWSISLVN